MNSTPPNGLRPSWQPACVVAGLAAAIFGLASAARADVLLVDPAVPSAYAQIQPAVDAAATGDLVIVHPLADPLARYEPFTVGGKTLAVVGDGALGTIRATTVEVTDLPTAAVVVIRGLQFVAPAGETAVVFRSGTGGVRLENCTGVGGVGDTVAPGPALYAAKSNSVIVNKCVLTGGAAVTGGPVTQGAPAVSTLDSRVTLDLCTVTGGAGANGAPGVSSPGGRGGSGIETAGGWQFVEDTTVNGGAGGIAGCSSAQTCACGAIGNGGDCVVETDTVLILNADTLLPGAPPESVCGVGFSGQPLSTVGGVVSNVPGPFHDFSMSYPVKTGEACTFHFQGVEGEWVYISAGTSAANLWLPKYDGSLHLINPNLLAFKFLRILDATGIHDTSHPVPPPPPGLSGLIGYTQATFVTFVGSTPHVHLGPSSTFLYVGDGP